MTIEQVESLDLGIMPIDTKTKIVIESGLEWVKENTTLEFDINTGEGLELLSPSVKLFLIKFFDIQMLSVGVSSESIEGLSQSYDTTDKNTLIWQVAEGLLYPYLKSRVRFVSAQKRWK
ncbi:MAG: hypothetical protein J6J23_00185 [Clostridia bacterium]|nr:hypothetical protein [Clostridia bacterium]